MISCYRLAGIRLNQKFLVVKQACRKDTERRAAEKQRRREEHERNRQRGIERRAAEARAKEAREAARRGEQPPLPAVIRKKQRRVDPKDRKD